MSSRVDCQKKGGACNDPNMERIITHPTQHNGRNIDQEEYDKNQEPKHLATWVGFVTNQKKKRKQTIFLTREEPERSRHCVHDRFH